MMHCGKMSFLRNDMLQLSKPDYLEFFLIQGLQVVFLANSYVAMVNVSIEVLFATVSMIAQMQQTKEIVVSLPKRSYVFAYDVLHNLALVACDIIKLTHVVSFCTESWQIRIILQKGYSIANHKVKCSCICKGPMQKLVECTILITKKTQHI